MLTDYERNVMAVVCNQHIRKAKTPIIINIDEFFNKWHKRGSFTPTFEKVCKKALSPLQINVLQAHFNNRLSVSDIAIEYSMNTSFVSDVINSAIDRLAMTIFFKELFVGTDEYEVMMAKTRRAMSNILRSDKDKWNDVYLDELLLDNRAINIFERIFQIPIKSISVSMVINRVKSLSNINNCGFKTRIHIIEVFRNAGVDVTNWDNELKEEMDLSKTIKKNVLKAQREIRAELKKYG